MAIIEDLLKGNPAAAAGVALAAVAAPLVIPSLRPQWAAFVKAGAKLFVEAEFGAEGEIIDKLVDAAVDNLSTALANPDESKREAAAQAVVRDFEACAHARSQRKGWDKADTAARYRRHMFKLRDAVMKMRGQQSGGKRKIVDDLLAAIVKA